ncbi:MAG: hypothetical protein JSW22_02245 [Chloroflexota bacterium]|nr:MAG: hypothetical protein JSW22_02245 [Chloroflexota bacterium]
MRVKEEGSQHLVLVGTRSQRARGVPWLAFAGNFVVVYFSVFLKVDE